MFKNNSKKAIAEFDLCAAGPVIVGSGTSNERDPRKPDNTFLTGHNGIETAYVIPGSSIKGVIRHYVHERINNKDQEDKLFGKVRGGAWKSKIAFHDAYADMSTIVTSIRYSTAIDPVLQKAKGGSLNNIQTVEKGSFKSGFKLVNYSDKELLLIIEALGAINEGRLRIGGRTSRGYGVMRVENFKMTVTDGYDQNLEPKNPKTYSSINEYLGEVR